jgi:RNA polymerase sigma factor (sigma-70 family)
VAETSHSLLQRLQQQPDAAAWQRLVEIYTPFIRRWLDRHALGEADRDDLTQDVLAVVVRRLPEFEHNQRTGAFRTWLRSIVSNRLRDFWRAQQGRARAVGGSDFVRRLEELEDPASGLSHLWDREHDRHVADQALEHLQPQFQPMTWQAFDLVARQGRRPAEAAAQLGMTVNAVLLAKSRVLRALRREIRGLAD